MDGDGQTTRDVNNRKFDLAERTAVFGEKAVSFARSVRRDAVTTPLIKQLVRAATSIGANYLEADEAGSRKEFRYRISLCKRESRETQYWIRMLASDRPEVREKARELWKEANEFGKIFGSIYYRTKAEQPPTTAPEE